MHIPKERCDFAYCVLRRKSAHSSENLAAKKRTFRRKGVILLVALCGEEVHLADAEKCTLGRYGVIFPGACCGKKMHIPLEKLDFACLLLVAKCGCEKVHIPVERDDFSLCVLRRKSANSSENLAPKNRTFGRKGVFLLNRAAAEKCTLIEKSGGEKAHILKERCDFASCLLR